MNDRIRILHYVSGFAETAGGVESFLYNAFLACENKTDMQLTLLTRYAYEESAFYKKFVNRGFKANSLGLKHLGVSQFSAFQKSLEVFFSKNQFDVLHMHGTDEPLVIACAKKYGVKVVLIHSHTPDIEMNGRKKWMRIIKLLWRKKNIKMADYYAGCSQSVLDGVFFKISNDKKFLITNCIDLESYKFDEKLRRKLRDELGIAEDTCVIGHVGRFADVKNQIFILKILKVANEFSRNWKAVLIGSGIDYDNIVKEAEFLGLQEKILFLGERMDVHNLLNVFDKFVFPSKFEGFPMTLIEVQANGVPCLISDVITDEVIITDKVKKESLDSSEEYWFNALDELEINKEREKYLEYVSCAGFGVDNLYKLLKGVYGRMLNES